MTQMWWHPPMNFPFQNAYTLWGKNRSCFTILMTWLTKKKKERNTTSCSNATTPLPLHYKHDQKCFIFCAGEMLPISISHTRATMNGIMNQSQSSTKRTWWRHFWQLHPLHTPGVRKGFCNKNSSVLLVQFGVRSLFWFFTTTAITPQTHTTLLVGTH